MPCRNLFVQLFLVMALLLHPIAWSAETETGTPGVALAEQNASDQTLRTGIAVTGGCVGGAVIGTVVPIFGNLVGCVVGGLAGWWFGHEDGESEAARRPQAAL